MNKKSSARERILVFLIRLICIIFLYLFVGDEMMWKIIPCIPLIAILIACFYDIFKKNK